MFPFSDNVKSRTVPYVTIGLILINAVCFVWSLQLDDPDLIDLLYIRGFVPARIAQLQNQKPLKVEIPQQRPQHLVGLAGNKQVRELPALSSQIYFSLVSSIFLHGGWMHLLVNMWYLWIFGDNVEDRLGHSLFAVFYILGGVAANLCHWYFNQQSPLPAIGASGAVATVLGAYMVTYPLAKIRTLLVLVVFITIVELPALIVLGGWFLMQLLEARANLAWGVNGGVALWAHIGGFVVGAALMPLLRAKEPTTDPFSLEHEGRPYLDGA